MLTPAEKPISSPVRTSHSCCNSLHVIKMNHTMMRMAYSCCSTTHQFVMCSFCNSSLFWRDYVLPKVSHACMTQPILCKPSIFWRECVIPRLSHACTRQSIWQSPVGLQLVVDPCLFPLIHRLLRYPLQYHPHPKT